MTHINHINLANTTGNVYCCLRNKIVRLNESQIADYCSGCKMNRGAESGKSVQCHWNDVRDVTDPYIVVDPQLEFISMQNRKLMIELPWGRAGNALA